MRRDKRGTSYAARCHGLEPQGSVTTVAHEARRTGRALDNALTA